MIDFDKKLSKEYLKTENRNVRWSHNVAKFILNNKRFLFALYVVNPFNINNYAFKVVRWNNIRCYDLIQSLTLAEISDKDKQVMLDRFVSDGGLKKYEKDEENDILYLTLCDGTMINIKKISDYIDNEDFNALLTSKRRMHDCHHGSINLAHIFEDCSDVVIGYSKLYNNRNKVLHSWLEAETSDGENVVIDYTLNAIINKDGFYKLMNVQPINRFKSSLVRNDLEKIHNSEYKSIDGRCYLLYRDELMSEIDKFEDREKEQ